MKYIPQFVRKPQQDLLEQKKDQEIVATGAILFLITGT
jgi:hypothetical protein